MVNYLEDFSVLHRYPGDVLLRNHAIYARGRST